MNTREYYIRSSWNQQWIPISDELKDLIPGSQLTLVKEDNDSSLYHVNLAGEDHTIMYSTLKYVSYVNRVIDISYRVEVNINGQYLLAREYQKQALIKYVLTKEQLVEVPHPNGGLFRATFSQLEDDHFQYVTEDNQIIHMRRIPII
jgi:DNA-directed RNA polymerase subunit L